MNFRRLERSRELCIEHCVGLQARVGEVLAPMPMNHGILVSCSSTGSIINHGRVDVGQMGQFPRTSTTTLGGTRSGSREERTQQTCRMSPKNSRSRKGGV